MTKEPVDLSQRGLSTSVRVVHPTELSADTLQTPGSRRMSAISAMQGVVSSMWAGTFVVEPSAKTGIHHHGEQETIVYVLEGEAMVRWGHRGEYSATIRAGDFLHVPSWLPHQEINSSNEYLFGWVVVRNTPSQSLSIYLTTTGQLTIQSEEETLYEQRANNFSCCRRNVNHRR